MNNIDPQLNFVLRFFRRGKFDPQRAWKKIAGPRIPHFFWLVPAAAAILLFVFFLRNSLEIDELLLFVFLTLQIKNIIFFLFGKNFFSVELPLCFPFPSREDHFRLFFSLFFKLGIFLPKYTSFFEPFFFVTSSSFPCLSLNISKAF